MVMWSTQSKDIFQVLYVKQAFANKWLNETREVVR